MLTGEVLVRLLTRPEARTLLWALRAASAGQPQVLLSQETILSAAELLRPGSAPLLRTALENIQAVLEGRTAVDAEVRPPWAAFLEKLRHSRWGGHVIIGAMGTGKTALAVKLAWTWHEVLGYPVEALNLWKEDLPDFARPLDGEEFARRLKQLKAYLQDTEGKAPPPPKRRVILIDEMSMAVDPHAADRMRRAAIAALVQSRHLEWIVIYVAQLARQIPLDLLSLCTFWVKKPLGVEGMTDRENPLVRDLWERAGEAFRGYTTSPWYRPPYDHPQAWAYVHSEPLGYAGLVPFTPYRRSQKVTTTDEEVIDGDYRADPE